jgi:hypothetical protein
VEKELRTWPPEGAAEGEFGAMIEFRKIVNESEVASTYLNFTDHRGQTFGRWLPGGHKTKLAIVDGRGRVTFAQRHHDNQIWGAIKDWFYGNNVQARTVVLVRYDKSETKEGCPVVHLEVQQSAVAVGGQLPSEENGSELALEEVRELALDECASEIPLSLERQLEDFLAANLGLIEPGLKLYVDEDGQQGKQYPTDVGIMDLLCRRPNGDLLVIELKRARSSDQAVGQISRYIGWVKAHLAGERSVFGLILVHERDDSLKYAVMANDKLTLRYFKLRLELVSEDEL